MRADYPSDNTKWETAMQNLLSASPGRAALRLALPGMAAMLASSLCALLDALLLGRRSASAAAAVSACLPILTIIQTIGFTLGTGAGSHISRSIGSGDKSSAAQAAQAAFYLAISLSVPFCLTGLLLRRPLVALLGAGDAASLAGQYALYVLLSGPVLCINLVLSSLLRGLGRMRAYMTAYVLGAAVGAALQFALIGHLGISGSGTAMLVRELTTLLILLFCARGASPRVLPRIRGLHLRPAVFADIMRSGLPVLVRQGLTSAAAAISARAASGFGESVLAGTGLAARTIMLISSAVIGFSQGFQPVIGYAAGRGDTKSARKCGRILLKYVTIPLLLVGAALYAFAPQLLSPFQPDSAVLAIAVRSLRAQSAVLFAQGAVIAMTALTQTLGMTVRGSIVAASRQGFILIPLLLILPRVFGLTGLLICQSVSDVLSLLLCFLVTLPAIRDSSCARCGCSDAR